MGQFVNSVKQNPNLEAESCTASQEIPRISYNWKVLYYCIPLVPLQNHINPVNILTTYVSPI
jgi:hypothetical protein